MPDSTEEIARRILDSVLRQLEGGAARSAPAPSADRAGGNGTTGSPIIVIMLGESPAAQSSLNMAGERVAVLPGVVQQPGCGCQNNSHTAGRISLQSSHPGLERFDLPEDKAPTNAPRWCFMEPDRACVNSGACETRGY